MNKSQTISVGLFFLLGLALLWIVHSQLSVTKSEGYEIVAHFDTLLQLRSGDDVRMAGVRVGSVYYTGLRERIPTAIFKIDQEFQIPKDSVAAIGMAGLLGNNLVSIQMGQSPTPISPGGRIESQPGFDINIVVNQLGELSQRVGGALENFEKILGAQKDGDEGIFQTIGRMIKENQKSITNTMASLDIISNQIASGQGTIGKLVMQDDLYEDLMSLSSELKTTLGEGKQLLSNTNDIVIHIKSGEGTLGGLIYGEVDLAAEVEALMANLREFSNKLNNPDSTIGRLLTDDELYGELQGMMRKANQTLDGLGDSAPISAISALATPLF